MQVIPCQMYTTFWRNESMKNNNLKFMLDIALASNMNFDV